MFYKKIKFSFFLSVFLSLVLFTSCSEDDDQKAPAKKSIVELASETSSLSTLVSALQKADLVSALKADGPFTVLAPSNDAFQALLDAKPTWSTLDDIPVEILGAVLKYHVISGKAKSTDLSNAQEFATLNGEKVTVDLSSGVKFKTVTGQSVSVTNADIDASNGVVHLIDKVLLPVDVPMNIVDLAIKTPELSTLVAAVKKAGLVDALTADGTMTVFAPTNAAFQALLDSNTEWEKLDDIPTETLKSVLLYHVAGVKALSTDLTNGQVIKMLSEANVTVNLSDGVKIDTGSGQSVIVVTPDVQGSNGVVHIIDKVMLSE